MHLKNYPAKDELNFKERVCEYDLLCFLSEDVVSIYLKSSRRY